MRWAVRTAVMLVFVSVNLCAQQVSDPLEIRTCDGKVVITTERLCLRGQEYYPVACVNENLICMETRDRHSRAVLDMSRSDSLCLTVIEGSFQMRISCCWERVFRGDEPLIDQEIFEEMSACVRLRGMIHAELGTAGLRHHPNEL